jgi:hypothetical protein
MDPKMATVYIGQGALDAETVRLFLESNGIPAFVIQESAGVIYGLTLGPLGEARVVVSADNEARAIHLLAAMEEGEFILPGDDIEPGFDEEAYDEHIP